MTYVFKKSNVFENGYIYIYPWPREVTGSNPVEVLTFSGFCSQLLKLRSKTAMIMAYLILHTYTYIYIYIRLETWQEYSQVRSVKRSGWQIIINFSNRYKLHLLYGLALAGMFHELVWAMLLSLKSQMRLLSSVEFLECACRNDLFVISVPCLEESFSVSPTYVSEVLLSVHVTVAW